jgi:pSer/pThr/pTyr-binding forkhead associated (FHA) protein
MDHEIYDPTIKTSIDELNGPIENPGSLVEATSQGETAILLDRSIIIIGCDEAADIKVEGRSIAPYHAEITHDNGEYQIRHLEGSAPVCVNGEAVSESILADGDSIAIRDRTFTFRGKSPKETTE